MCVCVCVCVCVPEYIPASSPTDIIDPAVLRPGRLDKLLFVGLPTPQDRATILNTITKVTRRYLGNTLCHACCAFSE